MKQRLNYSRHLRYFILLSVPICLLLATCQKKEEQRELPTGEKKKWKIAIIKYEELQQTEQAEQGIRAGLRDAGLVEGEDYEINSRSAQGDMPAVLSMVDAAVAEGSDMLVTLQTPTLHAAVRRSGDLPVVFMVIANPFVITTIGTSDSVHLPNVTGIYTLDRFDRLLGYIKQCMPDAKKVGTLYAIPELNAQFYKGALEEAALEAGFQLTSIGVTTRLEVPEAAAALCSQGIDAVCQIEDNLTSATFPSIVEAAKKYRKPVFSLVDAQADMGSVLVTAPDYLGGAAETAYMIARIIGGENPKNIPFSRIKRFTVIVNLKAARELGVRIPDQIVSQADKTIQ